MSSTRLERAVVYPRFYLAVAIVVLLLGIVVIGDRATGEDGGILPKTPSVMQDATLASRIASGDYYAETMASYAGEVPERFVAEVSETTDAENVYVAAEGGVVALEMNASDQRCVQLVRGRLEARGWALVESGSEMRFSALKDKGTYRWAYVDVSGGEERTMVTFVLRGDGDAGA